MALPAPVATQLSALNANVTKLLQDRDRVDNIFDDGLGNSVYNLLSAANRQAFKTAIVNDMQVAVTALQAVVTALAGM